MLGPAPRPLASVHYHNLEPGIMRLWVHPGDTYKRILQLMHTAGPRNGLEYFITSIGPREDHSLDHHVEPLTLHELSIKKITIRNLNPLPLPP